ncbi:hypothetical protein DPMN_077120 [Dreissena polymorpha]|uniref:WSC domain-containing protein n=1 Tax=Dreissena polymorpha TaxID=45954 RepID=A0A9D3YPZ3_DREPO|nr:hypothetical protein DPMN_077120 [Dreissena polymorpha]
MVLWICIHTCLFTEGIFYVGCYLDSMNNRVLSYEMSDLKKTNTPEECARICRDYRYAGVEFGKKCFCGNSIRVTNVKPESECNYSCTGDSSKMCGGLWRINVYTNWEGTTHPSIYEDDLTTDSLKTAHINSSTTRDFNAKIPSTHDSTDTSAEYIGLAVGLMCGVGAVVVIIVLQRRGALVCKHGRNTDTTNKTNPGSLAITSRSYEDTVDNLDHHNYFILEQRAQTVEDTVDQINTAVEPNEDNSETDHYNSIEVTEVQYEGINDGNGNYDHTTITLTEPVTRKPDNIYNKLNIDRPGNYDQLGKLEHNMSQAGNDYDTTDLARRNDVVGDYSHITQPVSTTVTRGDETMILNKGTIML